MGIKIFILFILFSRLSLGHEDDSSSFANMQTNEIRSSDFCGIGIDLKKQKLNSEFFHNVDLDLLRTIYTQMEKEHGKCRKTQSLPGLGYRIEFQNATTNLNTDYDENGNLAGLFLAIESVSSDSFKKISNSIIALRMQSAAFLSMDGKEILSIRGDKKGNAKASRGIPILALLKKEISANRLGNEQIVRVDERMKTGPKLFFNLFNSGSPVTLDTLKKFILLFDSDTAIDHLVIVLGRNRVNKIEETGYFPLANESPANVPKPNQLDGKLVWNFSPKSLCQAMDALGDDPDLLARAEAMRGSDDARGTSFFTWDEDGAQITKIWKNARGRKFCFSYSAGKLKEDAAYERVVNYLKRLETVSDSYQK